MDSLPPKSTSIHQHTHMLVHTHTNTQLYISDETIRDLLKTMDIGLRIFLLEVYETKGA